MEISAEIKHYLPRKAYKYLEQFCDQVRENSREDIDRILQEIQKGNDSVLTDREAETLTKLFGDQFINRQNIIAYYRRFSEIESEDVIWTVIIDCLEIQDFQGAEREYEKYKKYIASSEFLKLKAEYQEESVWAKINNCLSAFDLVGADSEYRRNSGLINEHEYKQLRKQYVDQFRKTALTKIKEHLMKYNFFGADVAYEKHKDLISKDEYLRTKKVYADKYKEWAWNTITKLWIEGDFRTAEQEYKKFQNIISIEEYNKERQKYKEKYKNRALAKIIVLLRKYDFAAADREYDRFSKLIPESEYSESREKYEKRYSEALLNKIKEYWEKAEFEKADTEFKKYIDVIPEQEYLDEKSKYLEKLKKQILLRIKNYADKSDIHAAENEYRKYRDLISETEFSDCLSTYRKNQRISAWQRIKESLEEGNFERADNWRRQHSDLISDAEFINEWNKYKDKLKSTKLAEIRAYLGRLDFVAADTIYKEYKQIIELEEYQREKREYLRIRDLWNDIMMRLERYDFGTADEIVGRNRSLAWFFKQEDYEHKRIDYLQKYFMEEFVDGLDPFRLDQQQATAVAAEGHNMLVSARAGSGKTRVIVGKILYLIEKKHVSWDSIYVLAFNRNVPQEIAERIQRRIVLRHDPQKYSRINVAQTFHKLALMWSQHQGKVLAEGKSRFIKLLIEHLKETNPDFGQRVYDFFREESLQVDKKQFRDPEDYYVYLRNSKFRSLRGDLVKSRGEKWIADFLYEHGIDFRYEFSFFPSYIDVRSIKESEDYQQRCQAFLERGTGEIKPDFYLVEHNLVWEHWGIDENEPDPQRKKDFQTEFGTTWEEYKAKMDWKRDFWLAWRKVLPTTPWAVKQIRDVKKLIETSVNDLYCSRTDFEWKLKYLLSSEKIPTNKRNQEELIPEVWERAIDRFALLMESFINRFQQKFFDSREVFKKRIENFRNNGRVYEFLKLGLEVLEMYEGQLAKNKKISKLKEYEQFNIDFNKLLLVAIHRIESGDADIDIRKMKYVLIDEYQDFSELFYRMISTIRKRNPDIRFFCVGDEWQAINRFAGSDVCYFREFETYFEDASATDISTNYRSHPQIISKSNQFMLENGFEGAPARPSKPGDGSSIYIEDVDTVFLELRENKDNYQKDKIYIDPFTSRDGAKEKEWLIKAQYLKKCIEIIRDNPDKQILILHRKHDLKQTTDLGQFYNKLCRILVDRHVVKTKEDCKKRINIRTIHTAKGLEADVVILLEINQGIIPMVHPDNELFEIFGEDIQVNLDDQKRLFYVAITRAKEKLYILTESEYRSDFLKLMGN